MEYKHSSVIMADDDKITCPAECIFARWAWYVSLIPILGVPLYIGLAFIALYHIGKGFTGLWLLQRGVIAVFLITIVPYCILYFSGYSSYNEYVGKIYYVLPKHGVYQIYYDNGQLKEQGYWHFGTANGKFTRWYDDGQIKASFECNLGKMEGMETHWSYKGHKVFEGENKNDRPIGIWKYWNDEGQLAYIDTFDDKGKQLSSKRYVAPIPPEK